MGGSKKERGKRGEEGKKTVPESQSSGKTRR